MELFHDHRPLRISIEINERFFAETTYFEYPPSPFPFIGGIFFSQIYRMERQKKEWNADALTTLEL